MAAVSLIQMPIETGSGFRSDQDDAGQVAGRALGLVNEGLRDQLASIS